MSNHTPVLRRVLGIFRATARRARRFALRRRLIEVHIVGPGDFQTRLRFPGSADLGLIRQSIALQTNMNPGRLVMDLRGERLHDSYTLAEAGLKNGDILNINLARHQGSAFIWKGIACNPFSADPLPGSVIRKTRWFHQENNRDRAVRKEAIRRFLDRARLPRNQLVAMTFNQGFFALFANWAASLHKYRLPVREQCIVFPMDAESERAARNLGFFTCYVPESKILRSTGTSSSFGDAEFVRHIYYQTAVIRDLLDFDVDVLFQDVDLVWLKNPLPPLSRSEHDIEFMYDGPTKRHAPLCANTGFMYFRRGTASRHFWNVVFAHAPQMFSQQGQQIVVNKLLGILCPLGLDAGILDSTRFVNGHLVGVEKASSRIPEDPWVIHFSWTLNLGAKYLKYRSNGHWYQEDQPRGGPGARVLL